MIPGLFLIHRECRHDEAVVCNDYIKPEIAKIPVVGDSPHSKTWVMRGQVTLLRAHSKNLELTWYFNNYDVILL